MSTTARATAFAAGPERPLVYLGRVDNQIKVQGYRVELGEIEAVIRKVAVTDVAIAMGYPMGPSGADGVVGFISKAGADLDAIRDTARARLPSYMQPSAIHHVDEFPLNSNGKVDRKACSRRSSGEMSRKSFCARRN